MAFLGAALAPVVGGLLGIGSTLLSRQKAPMLPKPVTRDDAREEAEQADALARRQGAAADRIKGASGEPVGFRLIRGS